MIKTITKIGNSKGIIFDAALLELANLKEGDKLNVTVHEGGTITLVPDVAMVSPDRARERAARLIAANDELFQRLSQ
jgi:antitoxin component of MazEF toxin-antitoxin module